MSPVSSSDRRSAAAHVLLDHDTPLDVDGLTLTDDIEHHLRRVLRLRDGEAVSVTDGAGSWRMAAVRVVGSSLTLEAATAVDFEARVDDFRLASAIPQGDRVEWLVQKTTELGADRVTLLHTARSTVRWKPDRAARHVARLQRIADEATRQSRRVWRTVVDGPLDASAVLPGATVAEPGGESIGGREPLIAIGPEGGWTPEELAAAHHTVSLGVNILRVETAAITATALRMVEGH